LQRGDLEALALPLLAPSIDAFGRVLASAGLASRPADAVLLVGGSSRLPLVAREVGRALGRPVGIHAHPKYPVALGAALTAARLGAGAPAGAVPPIGATEPGSSPPSRGWRGAAGRLRRRS
ncbi:MAG TPA: Hsp70 family protein, partial [Acidimicrobiales bacterium]|nr:Hsp70 family protein [Acidimicrobiales bacterium]